MPAFINTVALARCRSIMKAGKPFQRFATRHPKPSKRLALAGAPLRRAKAAVLMRTLPALEVPMLIGACASIVIAASLVGCGTPTNSVQRADPVGQRQMVDDKRLLVDASLDLRARVVGVNQAMTAGGLLKVQAEIMNQSRYQKKFNYRWEWFDQNGMQVSTPGTDVLIPVVIEGKESKFISGLAPTPACQDFRLKLIRPY